MKEIRFQLQNKAKDTKRTFMEILQYYAMERFLYRLSISKYSDLFILKGALIFQVFKIQNRRTTLDIDFLAYFENEIKNLEKIIKEICRIDIQDDGLIFDPDSVIGTKIKEGAEYEGVRIKFKGFLGKSKISMQIDIGFGDVISPKPQPINYPTILNFPNPKLKGYSLESIIAEKFESMVKIGAINSRMKDFYDIWLISRQFDFKGEILKKALKQTFTHRKTELPKTSKLFTEEFYDEGSDKQTMWKSFLTKNQINSAPEKLVSTVKTISDFLTKPVQAINNNQEFNYIWNTGKAWRIE